MRVEPIVNSFPVCKPDVPPGATTSHIPKPDRFATHRAFVREHQARLRRAGAGAAAALWLTLWDFENATTGLTEVGVSKLAACYGTDAKAVRRMLAQLQSLGYLSLVSPGQQGRGSCAVYRLTIPEIGGTMPPIGHDQKGGMVPPIGTEKGAREPRKGGMVPHVQKQKEEKTEERAPGDPEPVSPRKTKTAPAEKVETTAHPPGSHAEAVRIFTATWRERHGRDYPFQGGRDAKHITNVLTHLGNDLNEFAAVVGRFFAHPDPWFGDNGHTLQALDGQLAKFLVATPRPAPPANQFDNAGRSEARAIAQVRAALAGCLPPEPPSADTRFALVLSNTPTDTD